MNKNFILKREANQRAVISFAVALFLGLSLGYFLGRWALQREWLKTTSVITEKQFNLASAASAEPTPAAGARVLLPLPLRKSREALAKMTENDPVVVIVGAVGRSGDDVDLHLTMENRGKCKVTSYQGVAYGFDAWGKPSQLNKAGEHYVAISGKDTLIEPGKKFQSEMSLHNVENASLAIAHLDKITCEDGTNWVRN